MNRVATTGLAVLGPASVGILRFLLPYYTAPDSAASARAVAAHPGRESAVLWLGLVELLRASQILVTRLQEPLFILLICGAIYFLLSFPVARLGGYLEKRWSPND